MRSRSLWALAAVSLLLFVLVGIAAAQDAQPASTSYTVERGDSLDSIGAFYDVQVACLARSNGVERGRIQPGDVLTIDFACPRYDGYDFVTNPRNPNAAISAALEAREVGQGGGGAEDLTYFVEARDTLDTIGQALNVSSVALAVANGIAPGDLIFPGQALIVPAGIPPYGVFPGITTPSNPGSPDAELGQGGGAAGPVHVVQPQETLDRVGAIYDVQVACLAEANSITNRGVVFPGQEIVIPEDCPRYDGYDFVVNPRDGG